MRTLIAFLLGAAFAVLLGAATARGVKVKWQYRLLDLDKERADLEKYVSEVTATTRMNFANDGEARAAAEADSFSTWHARTFGDGWIPLSVVSLDESGWVTSGGAAGRHLLIGRPLGLRVEQVDLAFDQESVIESLAARDAAEGERAATGGSPYLKVTGGPYRSDAWMASQERRDLVLLLVRQRLDKLGANGVMLTPSVPLFGYLNSTFSSSTISD